MATTAATFNTNPDGYDRFRPEYPTDLIDQILATTGAATDTRALEIGIGTGQATRPFLDAGIDVTAIEPGDRLAEFSRRKFAAYPAFRVEATDFASYSPDALFDLIYAGTAFHWVAESGGLAACRKALKPGGWLALFWNHPAPLDPIHAELQPLYARFQPPTDTTPRKEFDADDAAKVADSIRRAGFTDVSTTMYQRLRHLSADDYIGLLRTYSPHIALEPANRDGLEGGIRHVIARHGGTITIRDTLDLHMGRNP